MFIEKLVGRSFEEYGTEIDRWELDNQTSGKEEEECDEDYKLEDYEIVRGETLGDINTYHFLRMVLSVVGLYLTIWVSNLSWL